MTRNLSRILSPTEVEQMRTVPPGRGHPVRKVLQALEVGQAYFIDRLEWNWISKTPRVIMNQVERRTDRQFKMEEEASGNGWVITRTG